MLQCGLALKVQKSIDRLTYASKFIIKHINTVDIAPHEHDTYPTTNPCYSYTHILLPVHQNEQYNLSILNIPNRMNLRFEWAS